MPRAAEHTFKTIESDLAGGALREIRAALLFGEEGYLTDHYEHALRGLYVSQGMEALDFSRISWDAKDVPGTVADTIAACDTLPMMSGRRVVLVSVAPGDEKSLSAADAKLLAAYLASVPDTTLLIMVSASVPKNSALYKAFASHGRAYEFTRLGRPDLIAFVKSRFKRSGAAISPDVVSEIIKVSGYLDRDAQGDLFRHGSDIAHIIGYIRGAAADGETAAAAAGQTAADADGKTAADGQTGGPVTVTLADVAACMGTSIETDVFAMLDAVSSGRKGDAMELLRNITARGENAFGLLALLTGQFEIMLGYRELKERRASMPQIMDALGVKSEFRLRKAAGFADRYDAGRIADLLHRLYRVDRDIKSGLYGERLALTMFVAEM
jgi:DNA polymerase-3 subunit delta